MLVRRYRLPLFAVPTEMRQWAARVRAADRNAVWASLMLAETAVLYAAFIALGETIAGVTTLRHRSYLRLHRKIWRDLSSRAC